MPFRGGSDYLIFRRSTEARYNTDVTNLSPAAALLISKCIQVDTELRPTIDEVLADPYFHSMPAEIPQLDAEQLKLREFCDDLIKRKNVHEFDGKEAFEAHFA